MKSKCCKNCRNQAIWNDLQAYKCDNPSCPCHTKQQECVKGFCKHTDNHVGLAMTCGCECHFDGRNGDAKHTSERTKSYERGVQEEKENRPVKGGPLAESSTNNRHAAELDRVTESIPQQEKSKYEQMEDLTGKIAETLATRYFATPHPNTATEVFLEEREAEALIKAKAKLRAEAFEAGILEGRRRTLNECAKGVNLWEEGIVEGRRRAVEYIKAHVFTEVAGCTVVKDDVLEAASQEKSGEIE